MRELYQEEKKDGMDQKIVSLLLLNITMIDENIH